MRKVVVVNGDTDNPTWAFEDDAWWFEVPDDWTKEQITEQVQKMHDTQDWSEL